MLALDHTINKIGITKFVLLIFDLPTIKPNPTPLPPIYHTNHQIPSKNSPHLAKEIALKVIDTHDLVIIRSVLTSIFPQIPTDSVVHLSLLYHCLSLTIL